MAVQLENVNPKVYKKVDERHISNLEEDEELVDDFDSREIFGKLTRIVVDITSKPSQ